MTSENTEDYHPRDIGTSLASCIAIVLISTAIYGGTFSEKEQIATLKNTTWYEVELTPEQSISFEVFEWRNGDFSLYIHQNNQRIYERSCKGFTYVCKKFKHGVINFTNATLYSNQEIFKPNSHLILKSIDLLDEHKKQHTINVNPSAPNSTSYIKKQKRSFLNSSILMLFIFSIFTLGFYFNHLARYSASIKIIKIINNTIIAYYFFTIVFVIIQYIRM